MDTDGSDDKDEIDNNNEEIGKCEGISSEEIGSQ